MAVRSIRHLQRQLDVYGVPADNQVLRWIAAQTRFEYTNLPTAGVTTFLALTDTPDTFAGQGTKLVRVNAAANALEFYTIVAGDLPAHQHAGGDITSGTIADARLSANVALKDAANTWAQNQGVANAKYFETNTGGIGIGASNLLIGGTATSSGISFTTNGSYLGTVDLKLVRSAASTLKVQDGTGATATVICNPSGSGANLTGIPQSGVTNLTGDLAAKASGASLTAHTSDTANPHATTAAQVGSTTTATFNTHVADGAAHGATSANTALAIVRRNADGKFEISGILATDSFSIVVSNGLDPDCTFSFDAANGTAFVTAGNGSFGIDGNFVINFGAGDIFTCNGIGLGFFNTPPVAQAAANPDTSGATLAQLETEVNQLKQMARYYGLLPT